MLVLLLPLFSCYKIFRMRHYGNMYIKISADGTVVPSTHWNSSTFFLKEGGSEFTYELYLNSRNKNTRMCVKKHMKSSPILFVNIEDSKQYDMVCEFNVYVQPDGSFIFQSTDTKLCLDKKGLDKCDRNNLGQKIFLEDINGRERKMLFRLQQPREREHSSSTGEDGDLRSLIDNYREISSESQDN